MEKCSDGLAAGLDRNSPSREVNLAIPSETLADQIKLRIKIDASPRDAPAKVIAVEDIPRTISGKTAELAVSDQIHGRTAKNTAALANPEALLLFENIRELQS